MSKLIRWAGMGVGAVLVLMIVAIVVLPMIIDPNDYKPEISAAVESNTGRTLTMDGDLKLSVFPWLGIEIGQSALSNAKGFSAQPFAQVSEVQIRVKLLPLLSRQLVMDAVKLKGLQISLETDKSGKTNWQDLSGDKVARVPSANEKPEIAEDAPLLAGLAIGGIEISDARIIVDDRQNDSRLQIDDFNLTTGAIGSGDSVPVSLSMKVSGTGLPGNGLAPELEFDLALDPEAQTLQLSDLRFELAGLTLEGKLAGTQIMGDARFDGVLKVKEFVPRDVMKALGQSIPETSDPLVLGRADAELKLAATMKSAELSAFQIRLDDSTVEGSFSVTNFSHPAIRFDVRLDKIDVDRYLPQQQETAPGTPATPATATVAGASLIPVGMLRSLDVAGKLSIGELKATQLRSRDVTMQVKAKDGVARVYPATASMYEGNYKGDIKLDVRGKTPIISMNESLSGIQIGPLLKDLFDQDKLQGQTEISAQLTAKGQTPDEFKRTLNGKLAFAFTDGAVKGVNLVRVIRKGQALLKGKMLPQTGEPEQTDFSELSGSATVVNGVIHNKDLQAKSPLLRVDGKGKVSLPAETIDYIVTTKLIGSLEGQSGKELKDLRGIAIPVQISGTFSRPVIKPKLDSAVKDVVKKEIENKVKKKFGQELEKQLGDKLKGFLR
ncbi:A/G-specific adenine glycosylase [hydrothermal vent metagenome]|uniref:A/G-specific adenine glycosylase n=1 Tax=hydrothermal vent metagenome TaxID=652676 RepID=A0A3B0YL25_9ZZZZ